MTKKIIKWFAIVLILPILIWLLSYEQNQSQYFDQNFLKKYNKIAIILPHSDDELTASILLKRLIDNKKEALLIVLTDGRANQLTELGHCAEKDPYICRTKDQLNALNHIKLHKIFYMMLPDGKLDKYINEASQKINEIFSSYKPDLIITFEPSGMNGHIDHKTSYTITERINNKLDTLLITSPKPLKWFLPSSQVGKRFCIKLSSEEVDLKASMTRSYKSEKKTISQMMLWMPPEIYFRFVNYECFYQQKA